MKKKNSREFSRNENLAGLCCSVLLIGPPPYGLLNDMSSDHCQWCQWGYFPPLYMNVAGNHQLVLIDNDATKITMIYSRSKKFSFFSLISRQKGCYLAIFYFLTKHLLNGWDSGRGNPKLFWRPRPNPTIWWQIRQLGLSGNPPTWFRTKTSNLDSQDVRS